MTQIRPGLVPVKVHRRVNIKQNGKVFKMALITIKKLLIVAQTVKFADNSLK